MYPFVRLAIVAAAARRKEPLALEEVATLHLTCWPWDLDMFAEMNNGRVLTLYDLGRLDHAARIGLSRHARSHGWGFAVGGASVRYRRRVRAFDRISLRTRGLGHDMRWFYMHQAMVVRGEAASAGLMRVAVTSRGRIVPPTTVLTAMGRPDWAPTLPDWAAKWIAAEAERPWPPDLAAD
ncbi:acyl-CoA thioesterase [Rubrimonas cliftonensis]|nr:acyl-CoA thioesterase [Rubrimonas cliftonensis]